MMRPQQVQLAERLVLLVGMLVVIAGISLYDWRAGVVLLGIVLIGITVEVPRR